MDRLAIIEAENIVQPMVRISFSRKHFLFQENIKTMDRLAITQERKIIETTFRFSIFKKRLKLWIDWL